MSKSKKQSLPSWYKIDNYAECKDYNYIRWWLELSNRESLYQDIINLGNDDYTLPASFLSPDSRPIIDPKRYHIIDKKEFDSILKLAWLRKTGKNLPANRPHRSELLDVVVTNTPISQLIEDKVIILTVQHRFNMLVGKSSNIKRKADSNYFKYRNIPQRIPCAGAIIESENNHKRSSIKLTTWRDTLPIYEEWDRNDYIREAVYHSFRDSFDADNPELCELAHRPINNDLDLRDISVLIDLSATNKKIIEDLEIFLKHYRKNSPKRFEYNELRKLYQYNVLAIIDFHLYGLLNKKSVEREYGVGYLAKSIMFPEVTNMKKKSAGDWYTRYAKPYALNLLRKEVLSSLFHATFP